MLTAESITEKLNKATESKIQIYPCHNLRASNIGHPCERYLYLLIKHWDQQKPIDITTQQIFDLGNKMEEYAIEKLKNAGFEIVTPAVRSWQIDNPYISGREDILIKDDDGELIPGEIKGISPMAFPKLNTIQDFLDSKKYYIRGYPMQLLTYMWKYNKERGFFFIVNKLTGELKPILLSLKDHEELMLKLLEKATRVNNAVAEDKIPEPIDEPSVCDECPLAHICGKAAVIPTDVEVDDELDELIEQRDALKESKKTYEELDEQIKAKVGERERVLSGKYLIVVTRSVTPAHTEPEKLVPEKVVRRFKYQKIVD